MRDLMNAEDTAPRPPTAQDLRVLNVTTKVAARMLGSMRLLKRLRHAGWLLPLYSSRDALYPVSRIMAAQARMEAGELPPLLPSELRERARRQRTKPHPVPLSYVAGNTSAGLSA